MKHRSHGHWMAVIILLGAVLIAHNFPVATGFCIESQDLEEKTQIQQPGEPDIQWFKQELRIDPKYQDNRKGILGMSWAHFLIMAFLVIFFFGALIAYHRRTTRTARILERLLKED
jgi:threonine/homoserine/homoserine lactone efflux protein